MGTQTFSPTVVLVHGAWADGSSWSRVITGLHQTGIPVVAAPIPLTTLDDDVNALDRTIDRTEGPVVVVGHAYAGGVIGATKHSRVRALVYVAALAPDEGETVADVFYAIPHTSTRPNSSPTTRAGFGCRSKPLPRHSPSMARPNSMPCWQRYSGRSPYRASSSPCRNLGGKTARLGAWSPRKTG
jgi:pimeloyl-ACP methyl ester carboxylesterase